MTPQPLEIRVATSATDLEHVRILLREYNNYLHSVIAPEYLTHRTTELADLPGSFAPPHGALLLACLHGQPAGCAGLRPITLPDQPSTVEFCRLWVTPTARGNALGEHLLHASIERARNAGHHAMVLNSAAGVMRSAQALYARAGFIATTPYKYVAIPDIQFFRLSLAR